MEGYIKLNVDASRIDILKWCQIVGVLRDHEGNFLRGFVRKITWCSILEAEVAALKVGTDLVRSADVSQVILEFDSAKSVELATSLRDVQGSMANDIQLVRDKLCF